MRLGGSVVLLGRNVVWPERYASQRCAILSGHYGVRVPSLTSALELGAGAAFGACLG